MTDNLTPAQRIRLEALNQATSQLAGRGTPVKVVAIARVFESYIEKGIHLADSAAMAFEASAIHIPVTSPIITN